MAAVDKKKPKSKGAEADVEQTGGGSNKLLVIIIIVLAMLLVVGGAVVTTVFVMMDKSSSGNIEEVDESLQINVEHPIKQVSRSDRKPKEMGFEKRGLALYHTIEPTFMVALNNSDASRSYLRVDIAVMARNPNTLEAVKRHEPLIKNDLLALFSNQSRGALLKPTGKEQLQKKAVKVINGVIGEHTDAPEVEEVLFVNFIVQ